MQNKICSSCGNKYPATKEYFSVNNAMASGLNVRCKKCARKYQKTCYLQAKSVVLIKGQYYGPYLKINGKIVKKKLIDMDMRYTVAAKKLNINVGTFCKWLNNGHRPLAKNVLKLIELLQCEPEEIILSKRVEIEW